MTDEDRNRLEGASIRGYAGSAVLDGKDAESVADICGISSPKRRSELRLLECTACFEVARGGNVPKVAHKYHIATVQGREQLELIAIQGQHPNSAGSRMRRGAKVDDVARECGIETPVGICALEMTTIQSVHPDSAGAKVWHAAKADDVAREYRIATPSGIRALEETAIESDEAGSAAHALKSETDVKKVARRFGIRLKESIEQMEGIVIRSFADGSMTRAECSRQFGGTSEAVFRALDERYQAKCLLAEGLDKPGPQTRSLPRSRHQLRHAEPRSTGTHSDLGHRPRGRDIPDMAAQPRRKLRPERAAAQGRGGTVGTVVLDSTLKLHGTQGPSTQHFEASNMDIHYSPGSHPVTGQRLQNPNLPTPSTSPGPPATHSYLVAQNTDEEALYNSMVTDMVLSTPNPEPPEWDGKALRGEEDE